jgi:hypothetical protein
MSIIRRQNWESEDFMFDVIHDLLERGLVSGLPNIGMYESREELYFNGKGSTTIGVLPEHIHAHAVKYGENDATVILVRFYQRNPATKPNEKIEEIAKYEFTPESQKGEGLTEASLAVSLFFFAERGWFESGVIDQDQEISSHGKVRQWATRHFSAYVDEAVRIYDHFQECAKKRAAEVGKEKEKNNENP